MQAEVEGATTLPIVRSEGGASQVLEGASGLTAPDADGFLVEDTEQSGQEFVPIWLIRLEHLLKRQHALGRSIPTQRSGRFGHYLSPQKPKLLAIRVFQQLYQRRRIRSTAFAVNRQSDTARSLPGSLRKNRIDHSPDPAKDGRFLREHNENNDRQHAETLRQLSGDELREAVEWFRSLPMWIELDSVAKGGSLCAYRWDGEKELSDEKFVWVDAHRRV